MTATNETQVHEVPIQRIVDGTTREVVDCPASSTGCMTTQFNTRSLISTYF